MLGVINNILVIIIYKLVNNFFVGICFCVICSCIFWIVFMFCCFINLVLIMVVMIISVMVVNLLMILFIWISKVIFIIGIKINNKNKNLNIMFFKNVIFFGVNEI